MEGELVSFPEIIVLGEIRVLFQEITNGFVRARSKRTINRMAVYVGILNNQVRPDAHEIFVGVKFCQHMRFAMVGIQYEQPRTLRQAFPDLIHYPRIDRISLEQADSWMRQAFYLIRQEYVNANYNSTRRGSHQVQ